ncbi:MAG TPA: universal stress protein [Chloroflexota bacterium]
MFRKILVPLDGSELAELALPYASRLMGTIGRLILLRATDQGESGGPLAAYLADVAEHLQQNGAAAEWRLCRGPAVDAITQQARLQRADSIVMSTHGRDGIQRLLHGSIAEHVFHDAEVPVVLVPARAASAWDAGAGHRIVQRQGIPALAGGTA